MDSGWAPILLTFAFSFEEPTIWKTSALRP